MTSPLLPPGIQVRDLSLRFGQHIVFDRLSFDIAGGSFVALLGASGAGKTSLLKIIAGLAHASSGSVTGSDGLPIAGRIAYMGQKDLLYPWLTIEENVALGSRLRGETPDRVWAAHLLERVGLAAHGRSLP
ncbi:ABC transporter ATP-binding protein, partial [Serratia marcescens]